MTVAFLKCAFIANTFTQFLPKTQVRQQINKHKMHGKKFSSLKLTFFAAAVEEYAEDTLDSINKYIQRYDSYITFLVNIVIAL